MCVHCRLGAQIICIHRKNILTGEGRNACHPKRTPLTQEEQPCLSTAHSMKVQYFQCFAYLRLRQFCRCLYQSVRPATLPPGTGRSHSLQPPVDLNSFHQLSQDEKNKFAALVLLVHIYLNLVSTMKR